MTQANLDLRRPTFVLVGGFNQLIFTPPWMALHLFGHEVGTQVQAEHVQLALPELKSITFIDGLGITATPARLEIFGTDPTAAGGARIEQLAIKVIETLWLSKVQRGKLKQKIFDWQRDNPGVDLTQTIVLDLASSLPRDVEVAAEKAVDALIRGGVIDAAGKDKAISLLGNSPSFRSSVIPS